MQSCIDYVPGRCVASATSLAHEADVEVGITWTESVICVVLAINSCRLRFYEVIIKLLSISNRYNHYLAVGYRNGRAECPASERSGKSTSSHTHSVPSTGVAKTSKKSLALAATLSSHR